MCILVWALLLTYRCKCLTVNVRRSVGGQCSCGRGGTLGSHAAGRRVVERRANKEIDTYTYPVVIRAVDVSGHAEVSDLHQQVLTHQAIPVWTKQRLQRHYTIFTQQKCSPFLPFNFKL